MRSPSLALFVLTAFLSLAIGLPSSATAQCGNLAFIPNQLDGTVSVIDTDTNTVIDTVTVGATPLALAVHPNGKRVYIVNSDDTVSVIDTLTNAVVDTITVSRLGGAAVLPDGSALYGTNLIDSTVSVIDTTTNLVTTTIPVGAFPSQVAVHPDGTTVYATIQGTGSVTVIDTGTNTVTTSVPTGTTPIGVAVTPDGSEVWVTNFTSDTVSVMSTATNTITSTIPGIIEPTWPAMHPDGSKVYVASWFDNEIAVIDATTKLVTSTIPLGGTSPAVAQVHPDGSKLYVCNSSSDNVDVISLFTNTVVETIPVGDAPSSLGKFITPSRNVTPLQSVFLNFGEIGVPVNKGDRDVFKEDGSVMMTLELGMRSGFDPEDIGYLPGTDRNVLMRQIADQVLADFAAMGGDDLDICFGARAPNATDFAVINILDGEAPIMNVANSAVVVDVSNNRLLLESGAAVGYTVGIEDGQLRRPDDTPVPDVLFPEYLKIKIDALGAAQSLDKGNSSLAGEAWVFVGSHDISATADDNLRELANSISHELGHLLGIEHSDGDTNTLMSVNATFGTDKPFSELSKRKLAEALPPLPPVPSFLGAGNRLRTVKIGDTDQHGTAMTGPVGGTTDEDAESIFREARTLLLAHADAAEEPFQFELAHIGQSGPEDGLYMDTPLTNGTLASYSLDLVEPGLVGTYVGARIELALLNVADVLGGASDFRVFVDGMELVGALDGLDQRLVAPEFAGYADAERVTLYLDDFLSVGQIATALADGTLDLELHVNGATSFVSVDSVIALVTDEGPLVISECGMGTVNLDGGPRADVLFINGSTGGALRHLTLGEGEQIWLAMLAPPAGGSGKFVSHLNAGAPTNQTLVALPANVGTACFPMISAAPSAVWNNIGKTNILGESSYFGSPISNPQRAPTIFLQLANGDIANLLIGTEWTLQGVILDPASLSPKAASATNAVVLSIE